MSLRRFALMGASVLTVMALSDSNADSESEFDSEFDSGFGSDFESDSTSTMTRPPTLPSDVPSIVIFNPFSSGESFEPDVLPGMKIVEVNDAITTVNICASEGNCDLYDQSYFFAFGPSTATVRVDAGLSDDSEIACQLTREADVGVCTRIFTDPSASEGDMTLSTFTETISSLSQYEYTVRVFEGAELITDTLAPTVDATSSSKGPATTTSDSSDSNDNNDSANDSSSSSSNDANNPDNTDNGDGNGNGNVPVGGAMGRAQGLALAGFATLAGALFMI